ncbi:MAG: hypothetical protein V1745_03435 [Patescibacteria group bacterium]
MLEQFKRDPKPSQQVDVIVVTVMGAIARSVRQGLGLSFLGKQQLQSDYQNFLAEHQKVRQELGYQPQIPEPRYVFSQFEDRGGEVYQQKGVPNADVGQLVADIVGEGYFLIHAAARVDDRKRDVVRLTFSRKESDRPIAMASPTPEKLVAYFKDRAYGFVHVWDRRWVRVDFSTQVGNVTVVVCGNEPRHRDCVTYRILRLGDRGANKGEAGLMSFDLAKRPTPTSP